MKIDMQKVQNIAGVRCDGTVTVEDVIGQCVNTSENVFVQDELIIVMDAQWHSHWIGIATLKHFCSNDCLVSFTDTLKVTKQVDASSGISQNPDGKTIEGDSANVLKDTSGILKDPSGTTSPPAGQENVSGMWIKMKVMENGSTVVRNVWHTDVKEVS